MHAGTVRMPGATSLFGAKRVTFFAMSEKMRRRLRNVSFMSAGAAFMLASSIHQAHSASGTMISALGKTSALSLVLMPLMWSGWKCEMAMTSTALGSMPAAARLSPSEPAVGAICPPVPVSSSTSLRPVLTTSVVNGVASLSAGMKASASAWRTSAKRRVADELVVDRAIPHAVIERGQFERADLVAVEAGRLLAGLGRRGDRRTRERRQRRQRGAREQRPAREARHVSPLMLFSRTTAPQVCICSLTNLRNSSGPASSMLTCCVSMSCLETFGLAQRRDKLGAEAVDDRLRRAGRREHAPPRIGAEAGKAAVADGRHVGQARGCAPCPSGTPRAACRPAPA